MIDALGPVTWESYATYLVFAVFVVLAPDQAFALVVRNTIMSGRRAGRFTTLGAASSNVVQGTAAALGLGALVVHSQPVFTTIRWVGVCYLIYLGAQALRSAWKGEYPTATAHTAGGDNGRPWLRWQQGFLSNITNPKVLALYLSVLPQFLDAGNPSTIDALALAYTHAIMSLAWLITLTALLHRLRGWVQRRQIRRTIDAATGSVLIGFGVRLAAETR